MKSKNTVLIVIVSILAVLAVAIWSVVIADIIIKSGDNGGTQREDSSVTDTVSKNQSSDNGMSSDMGSSNGNGSDFSSDNNSSSNASSTQNEAVFVTERYIGERFVPFSEGNLLGTIGAMEPGSKYIAYLRVSVQGEAMYDYQMTYDIANKVYGTNMKNEEFGLWDYVGCKLVRIDESELGCFDASNIERADSNFDMITTINGGETHYYAVVAYLPNYAGNEANAKPGAESSFAFNIRIMSALWADE